VAVARVPEEEAQVRVRALEPAQVREPARVREQERVREQGPEEAVVAEVHRRRCEQFERSASEDSRPLASDPLAVSADP
jgi:hypothetical protein